MTHANNLVLRRPPSIFAGRLVRQFASFRDERGSSLVEYAIVFVLLMTMLLAIVDFSRALYALHYVNGAARDAARYASVRGSTCGSDSSCTAANSASGTAGPTSSSDVQTFVKNVPMGIDSTKLSATATWPIQGNGPTICATTSNAPGCTVQVQVTYTFSFMFPFVSKSSLTMKSSSQMTIAH